jgi:hypothetical protein
MGSEVKLSEVENIVVIWDGLVVRWGFLYVCMYVYVQYIHAFPIIVARRRRKMMCVTWREGSLSLNEVSILEAWPRLCCRCGRV